MYCPNCGSRIPDDAVFCGNCGAPAAGSQAPANPGPQASYQQPYQQPAAPYQPTVPYQQPAAPYQPVTPYQQYAPVSAPAVPQRSGSDTLRMIFGIVLIVCGLIPYLFLTSTSIALSNAITQAAAYGDVPVAVISALSAFFNMTDALLRFPTRMLTILTGIVLLLNRWKPKGAAITCAVFNLLYTLLTFLSAMIVQAMPEMILSLYSDKLRNSGIIQALRLQDIIWQTALPQLLLCLLVAGFCFGFLFCKVQTRQAYRDRSVSNLYILFPCLALLRFFVNILPTILSSFFIGNAAMAGWSNANAVVNNQMGTILLWGIIAITVLCVVLRKLPFGWTALAVACIAILSAVLVQPGVTKFILAMGMPAEYLAYAMDYSRTILWSSALMLAAVFVWIAAITRNRVPLWLQWVLSCAIIPVYILVEVFCCTALAMGPGYGLFACAGVILIATLLAGFLDANKKGNIQYP